MATGLDANTASRMTILPALVRIAGRSIGPTRGGVTLTYGEEVVQPEADGVNQAIVGFAYKRSTTISVEFAALEFSPENLALANDNVAGSGTAPNLTFTPFANMTMMGAAQYLQSPGLQIFVPFSDPAVPGFWTLTVPNGRVRGVVNVGGATGEGTIQFTVTSAALASAPDAVPYTFGRVAALPSEVGGP
jgi:hypothetical protein